MIVISDTNIIYSCFYKPNGVIANILKDKKKNIQFIAPDYLLEEIEEHLPKIMKNNIFLKSKRIFFWKNLFRTLLFLK